MNNESNMNWIDIHNELNTVLASYYKQYGPKTGEMLFKKFKEYKNECIKILPFTKKFFQPGNKESQSFDPIHIFASFNYYGIHPDERKKRLKFYYQVFGLNHKYLNKIDYKDIFYTYPHLNIVHIVGMRSINMQREVWEFYYGVINNSNVLIEKYFDQAITTWYGLQVPSLTVFMFWINSSKFLPLDQYTVRYLQENFIIEQQPKNYNHYIKINQIFLSKNYSRDIFRSIACMALHKKTNYISNENKEELQQISDLYKHKYQSIKDIEQLNNDFLNQVKKSRQDDPEKRKERLKNANTKPIKSRITIKYYHRNPDVVAEVLERANGKCECCHKSAPFNRDKDNTPYLEVHHRKYLSKGGNDTVENSEALCPNCHRKKHFGRNS